MTLNTNPNTLCHILIQKAVQLYAKFVETLNITLHNNSIPIIHFQLPSKKQLSNYYKSSYNRISLRNNAQEFHLIFINFYLTITNQDRWWNMDEITFHLTILTKLPIFYWDVIRDISSLNQKHILNIKDTLTDTF
jgi:hypothetical protein